VLIAVTFQKGVLDTKYRELQILMAGLSRLFILFNGGLSSQRYFLPTVDQTQTYKQGKKHRCVSTCAFSYFG